MKAIKTIFLLLLFGTIGVDLQAAEEDKPGYAIANIPDHLLNNAKAVIRLDQRRFSINSPTEAILEVQIAQSILGKNAATYAPLILGYNPFIKIKSISGTVYDKEGKKVKTLKGFKAVDRSAISSGSIYEETRVKSLDPEMVEYPYTVEYRYEVHYKSAIYFPVWRAQSSDFQSVERATFDVLTAPGNEIKFQEKNIEKTADISEVDGRKKYSWSVKNIPVFAREPYALEVPIPTVIIVPKEFDMGGYSGSFSTWKDFGKWILALNKGKQNLLFATKQLIAKKTANATTDFEKIDILYRMMQDKVRYVFIAIGVGGFQPFDAETVDRLSYGDCKALTNYMKSCLDEVGITSYYTLVEAGAYARPIDKDFPSNQFNHAFLCIPQNEDTIWLECTSQMLPTGYSGTFTDDRDVLLIEEAGGRLVHTKVLNAEDNVQGSNISVELANDLSAKIECKRYYQGVFYEDMMGFLKYDDAKVKKAMYEKIDLPQFDLNEYHFEEHRSRKPSIEENLSLSIKEYGVALGSKILISLNCMNQNKYVPEDLTNRQSDIFFKRAYSEIDTVTYIITPDFIIDKIPKPVSIESDFGTYNFTIQHEGNRLIYIRHLIMNKGIYPKSDYAKMIAFFNAIVAADKKKFLLKRP